MRCLKRRLRESVGRFRAARARTSDTLLEGAHSSTAELAAHNRLVPGSNPGGPIHLSCAPAPSSQRERQSQKANCNAEALHSERQARVAGAVFHEATATAAAGRERLPRPQRQPSPQAVPGANDQSRALRNLAQAHRSTRERVGVSAGHGRNATMEQALGPLIPAWFQVRILVGPFASTARLAPHRGALAQCPPRVTVGPRRGTAATPHAPPRASRAS